MSAITYQAGQPLAPQLEERLAGALNLAHLEVVNESDQHNVPANSQTHFKLVLVSEDFVGETRINRHRRVNALVADFLAGEVHAMAIHPYTLAEWQKRFGTAPLSPPCLGGSAGQTQD